MLSGHQQAVEATVNSSTLLPDHRAILGMALSKFQLAEAGILEVFLSLAKGFETSSSFFAINSAELEEMK